MERFVHSMTHKRRKSTEEENEEDQEKFFVYETKRDRFERRFNDRARAHN